MVHRMCDEGEHRMRTMRIAVAGATGNIGTRTAAALERAGHEVAGISRSLGVDLISGGVLDATSHETADRDNAVAYFGTATANLLAAEKRAGVRHHVLLSLLGVQPQRD